MTDRGLHAIRAAEILADGLGLRRRLDDDERCRARLESLPSSCDEAFRALVGRLAAVVFVTRFVVVFFLAVLAFAI